LSAVDRVLCEEKCVSSEAALTNVPRSLTTRTKILFKVAQTRTKMPAPRTTLEAIFLIILRLEPHSMGSGIRMR
jgi:hypothetical protein